jgi:2-polyprenyl-3-methyl-5-hydroxy-6-metoxy-1,4-benzoquinol methylase
VREHTYSAKGHETWGALYRAAAFLWRRSPRRLRSGLHNNRARVAFREFLASFASREDLYSEDYYVEVDAAASVSAPTIVESIFTRFVPRRVIDVGCGTGAMLAEFRRRDAAVVGVECSAAALNICKRRGIEVHRFSIEDDLPAQFGAFDVAICCEVAEHVSAEYADLLVNILVQCAPRIIFTAATPGQGGTDHINEQPHEYWIAKFEKRGFSLLVEITEQWREEWKHKNVADCYARNVMVFEMARSSTGAPLH